MIGSIFVRRLLVPVEENLQDMTDFVHNAGHELKTPLSVMRGNLQVMQVEGKYDKKLLKKSIREIDNTNSLIEGLIELSQIGKLSERLPLALAIEV
jgi:signal transduction histidine kinase